MSQKATKENVLDRLEPHLLPLNNLTAKRSVLLIPHTAIHRYISQDNRKNAYRCIFSYIANVTNAHFQQLIYVTKVCCDKNKDKYWSA